MANKSENIVEISSKTVRDAVGLDIIYRRYRSAIHAYVLRTFGAGPPDPDDVVHAAFERFAALDDFSKVESPYSFLVRSVRNFVIDYSRRQAVRSNYALASQNDETDDMDAERVLSAKQELEILNRVIECLDPRRREILMMNRIDGISCAEIARRKGCSPTLVKMLISEALVICQKALEKEQII